MITIADYIHAFQASPLAPWQALRPWQLVARSEQIVRDLLARLPIAHYHIDAEVAVHRTARVEPGAVLKGPLIIGPDCLIASGAYLRGGCWVDAGCILGPGVELKSSLMFAGSKLAHFNFVGDSIIGSQVNLEAGSIVCNYRNERPGKEVLVRVGGQLQATGCEKFGALLGDRVRLGANAVLAPGALLLPERVVGRLSLFDGEQMD